MKLSLKFRRETTLPHALASGPSLTPSCHSLLSRILIFCFIMRGCQLISAVTSAGHIYSAAVTHLHCESIISLLSLLIRLCLWFCAPLKHPITAQSLQIHQIHQLHQPSSLRRVIFRRHHYRHLDPVGEFSWLLLRAEPPRSQNLPEESKCQRLSDKTRISQHLL